MLAIIKLLEKEVIDKIAAGEVITNGASVIKELVENSIDAKSTVIKISILRGGKKSIRVVDNGCGIASEDISNAFLRNATSKIEKNIDNIATLGFRGEALASISCVSKITIKTKTAQEQFGISAEIVDSEIIDKTNVAINTGTDIEVCDLFYNLPARYKYLNSDSEETTKIIDIVTKLAATNIDISFSLFCDNREIFTTDGKSNLKNTLSVLFGKDKISSMVTVDFSDEPLFVRGVVSSASYITSKPTLRVTVLNGRYVESKEITKTVDSVFAELSGKTGAEYVLYIDLPYSMIDVNVHPSKINVHFLNESLILMLIKQGLKECLSETFVVKTVNVRNTYAFEQPKVEQKVFEEVSDYFEIKTSSDDKNEQTYQKPVDTTPVLDLTKSNEQISKPIETNKDLSELYIKAPGINKDIIRKIALMKYVGNAFGVYALFETDTFLYAIDTHAAHERILYEKYLNNYRKAEITVQQLLVPIVVSLSPKDYILILNNRQNLSSIGFDIDDFGEDTIAVRSIPDFVDNDKVLEFINLIPEDLTDITTAEDFKQRSATLIKKACHNAIRGKMYISEDEARSLLKDLSDTDMPYTCPHGRQIIGKIDIRYFMKVFDRI